MKDLYELKGQGTSIRGIARELGVSRNSVRKYLRSPEVPPAAAGIEAGSVYRVRRPTTVRGSGQPRHESQLDPEFTTSDGLFFRRCWGGRHPASIHLPIFKGLVDRGGVPGECLAPDCQGCPFNHAFPNEFPGPSITVPVRPPTFTGIFTPGSGAMSVPVWVTSITSDG